MADDPRVSALAAEIIAAVKDGSVADRASLQNLKLKLCKKHGLPGVPPNSEILAEVEPEDRKLLTPFLLKKPTRTISGVAVVAVMTSPHDCPHGKCAYCPGGVSTGSPQSYTGKEPAARRAERNRFDPYLQVRDRLKQLSDIGHKTDKIDLIIMGGTFTSREPEYQELFVRRCFDAMNGRDSETLEGAQRLNEASACRCVGLTVETRPDVFDREQIERAMALGATRVELGVQILDDGVLAGVDRGHGVEAVRRCTRECREHGLKVCYHLMPGLPGSSPEKDLERFREVFEDPGFRPDMLKFYTTLVMEGTKLHDMWKAGEYEPYDVDTAAALLSEMKSMVPEYVRIQRIQRDIPVPQIAAGITKSNLRQIVEGRMEAEGRRCRCIRCREVGHAGISLDDPGKVSLNDLEYEASGGEEHFISFDYGEWLVGYVRLRLDSRATIRELKVFGKTAAIGDEGEDWQHRGFGRELVAEAERKAREKGYGRIRVTSGVGVRGYYRSLGYEEDLPYMAKTL
ncbi:MAG: tRNA uridine(34) 5-carboxymethylaminomethyl modification radical SAM/GNAT enzyme Elp3 [Candidatus Methanomethylophilaceae archaeon]|nr:tRNA uridine(34) 5-carboxymethylaminomethyl modification radical SAM/GNAT enzyme Elp3 [Candidatus Methanomethylophilaceae archaeon]